MYREELIEAGEYSFRPEAIDGWLYVGRARNRVVTVRLFLRGGQTVEVDAETGGIIVNEVMNPDNRTLLRDDSYTRAEA